MKHTFLGIDMGTSAIKLVMIDEQKNVLAQVTEEYGTVQRSQGWSEINPDVWYQSMASGMEKILEKCDRRQLKSIGITGQMHTLVTLDKAGAPVRDAILWNDMRAKELVPELKQRIADFREGEYLARTVSTGSPMANLYWLKQYEPENFKRIAKFLIGPDYLVYRLTGQYGTDFCEASTSCLYLLREKKWSWEIRDLIGLSEEVYPCIHGSAEMAGCITQETAGRFSLNPDVEVLTGTGDNPATAISTGCLGRGYPVISLGTSGVLITPVAEPDELEKGKMILFSFHGCDFSYLAQGAVQSNGNTFDWWVRKILREEDFGRVDYLVETDHNQESSVIFYPHLKGEKTLYADPDLRGAFINLTTETSRGDLLYAVMEGLCFGFRELAEKMGVQLSRFESIKVLGGGSQSDAWMQTMANVMNRKVEKMAGMTGPAFGIALLAAYHSGSIATPEQISEGTIKIERCFEPETDKVERCEKKYQKYLRIYSALKYLNG